MGRIDIASVTSTYFTRDYLEKLAAYLLKQVVAAKDEGIWSGDLWVMFEKYDPNFQRYFDLELSQRTKINNFTYQLIGKEALFVHNKSNDVQLVLRSRSKECATLYTKLSSKPKSKRNSRSRSRSPTRKRSPNHISSPRNSRRSRSPSHGMSRSSHKSESDHPEPTSHENGTTTRRHRSRSPLRRSSPHRDNEKGKEKEKEKHSSASSSSSRSSTSTTSSTASSVNSNTNNTIATTTTTVVPLVHVKMEPHGYPRQTEPTSSAVLPKAPLPPQQPAILEPQAFLAQQKMLQPDLALLAPTPLNASAMLSPPPNPFMMPSPQLLFNSPPPMVMSPEQLQHFQLQQMQQQIAQTQALIQMQQAQLQALMQHQLTAATAGRPTTPLSLPTTTTTTSALMPENSMPPPPPPPQQRPSPSPKLPRPPTPTVSQSPSVKTEKDSAAASAAPTNFSSVYTSSAALPISTSAAVSESTSSRISNASVSSSSTSSSNGDTASGAAKRRVIELPDATLPKRIVVLKTDPAASPKTSAVAFLNKLGNASAPEASAEPNDLLRKKLDSSLEEVKSSKEPKQSNRNRDGFERGRIVHFVEVHRNGRILLDTGEEVFFRLNCWKGPKFRVSEYLDLPILCSHMSSAENQKKGMLRVAGEILLDEDRFAEEKKKSRKK